jgi:hypothetical protein
LCGEVKYFIAYTDPVHFSGRSGYKTIQGNMHEGNYSSHNDVFLSTSQTYPGNLIPIWCNSDIYGRDSVRDIPVQVHLKAVDEA